MTGTVHLTVCQPRTRLVFDPDRSVHRERLLENASHYAALVDRGAKEWGSQLFVLPQFAFQGAIAGLTVDHWLAASIRLDGPELRELGRAARSARAYVAGTACETCDEFPGRYWHAAFVLGPDGRLAQVSRKLYALTSKTRPGDVLDSYVACFGRDALHPVLDTPFGRIAVSSGNDLAWPETVRCLALRGAEVVLNPICAGPQLDHLQRPGAAVLAQARAYENLLYVVTSNVGALEGAASPGGDFVRSRIVDFRGEVVAVAEPGPDQFVTTRLDLEGLRRLRVTPAANFLAQLQPATHLEAYREAQLWPVNGWRDRPLRDAGELLAAERAAWDGMIARGVVRGPSSA